MGITMKELAKLAGVSQSSVSLVLGNKAHGQVSETIASRIRSLAAAHRYCPNLVAKGLRNKRQYTIGIIMSVPYHPWYSQLVSLLQDTMRSNGYMGLFSFWREVNEIPEVYSLVRSHNVAGIIALDYHDCFMEDPLPTVFYDRKITGFDVVRYDYESGFRRLFERAAEKNINTAGYFGYYEDRRYKAVQNLVREFGFKENPIWYLDLHGAALAQNARQGLLHFNNLNETPGMLFVQNDSIARSMISGASNENSYPFRDTLVAGFGNELLPAFADPLRISFDGRVPELAKIMVGRILQRIEKPELPDETMEIIPELVVTEI